MNERKAIARTTSSTPLTSVDSALRTLTLLMERPSIRVSDAATELGVSLSTAHRLLSTLVYRDFATQDPSTREYLIGPAWHRDSDSSAGTQSAAAVVPYLELLSRELGETIQFLVLQGQMVRFIAASESTRVLRVASRVGVTLPAHCSSGGKVLLADLLEDGLEDLFPDERLPARTPTSITSRDVLEAQLAKVRRFGYATSIGEGEVDVSAVAVAVRYVSGEAMGAIVASGPRSRMPRKSMRDVADRMSWAARQITASL